MWLLRRAPFRAVKGEALRESDSATRLKEGDEVELGEEAGDRREWSSEFGQNHDDTRR